MKKIFIMKAFGVIFLSVVLVVCSNSSIITNQEEEYYDNGSGKPISPVEPSTTITFLSNWEEKLQGSLVPGEKVRIVFDAARLPKRDSRYGQKAWFIFAEVKYSRNGKVHSTILDGPDKNEIMTTTLDIPDNAEIFVIWFRYHGYYTGHSYDSNYGNNYEFPFTRIFFDGDWGERVNERLFPGGKFQVVYNATRLPWRDQGYLNTGRAWNIFTHAQFKDDGPVLQQRLDGPWQDNVTMTTVFEIPEDATKVELWFYFKGLRNGIKHDSNYGENYHFDLK